MAVSVGYCGLDRARLPLRGDEIRECWEEGIAASLARDPAAEPAELPVVDVAQATAAAEGSLGL